MPASRPRGRAREGYPVKKWRTVPESCVLFKQLQITRAYTYNHPNVDYIWKYLEPFGLWPQRVWGPHIWDEAEAWTHCLEESFTDAQGRDAAPRCLDVDMWWYDLWCVQVTARCSQIFHWVRDYFKSCWSPVQLILDDMRSQVFGHVWTTLDNHWACNHEIHCDIAVTCWGQWQLTNGMNWKL